jgi:hypothetical protein
MTTDLRSLDLHTLNIAIEAAANAVRDKGIHWERQSISAAFTGELNEALTCKNWAFASFKITREIIQLIKVILKEYSFKTKFFINSQKNLQINLISHH